MPGCRQIRRQLGRGDRILSTINNTVQGATRGMRNTVMSEQVTTTFNAVQFVLSGNPRSKIQIQPLDNPR